MNNFCPECGSERIENSKYCINCGYKFPVENNQYSNEDNFEPNYDVDYNNNYNENNNTFNYNGDNSHVDDNSICPHCSSQLNTYTKTASYLEELIIIVQIVVLNFVKIILI